MINTCVTPQFSSRYKILQIQLNFMVYSSHLILPQFITILEDALPIFFKIITQINVHKYLFVLFLPNIYK